MAFGDANRSERSAGEENIPVGVADVSDGAVGEAVSVEIVQNRLHGGVEFEPESDGAFGQRSDFVHREDQRAISWNENGVSIFHSRNGFDILRFDRRFQVSADDGLQSVFAVQFEQFFRPGN